MNPLGKSLLDCNFRGKRHCFGFQFVEAEQRPLLSAKTRSKAMRLVTVNTTENAKSQQQAICEIPVVDTRVQASAPLTYEGIKTEYSDVFYGHGSLPGL